jgi:pyruvate/2-oxoacid:ferredoxin oxidoreductase beta subunit
VTSYLHEEIKPYPFCPGCGHGPILDALNSALVALQPDPRQIVVVVDIGCVALTREYWKTNWFLGLHGRSVTYATGIKLANPSLKVIVLIGDGGLGIGGHHLINAARRNIGLTVVVFNNLNFGMTGGEHSVTTPQAAVTATTAYGHLERPLDVCALMAASGASFVARTTTFDANLADLLTQALRNEGFSVVDVWEPCTSYFVPNNRFGRKQMESTLAGLGFSTGIVGQVPRPEYGSAYRAAVAAEAGRPISAPVACEPRYGHQVKSGIKIVVAGAAGKKIISAVTLFCEAAMLCGLWAGQRSDYPVAVGSGYSVSEVVLSPEESPVGEGLKPSPTGRLQRTAPTPDRLVVLFPEGLRRVRPAIERLAADDILYLAAGLPPVPTQARTVLLDFARTGSWLNRKETWALMALAHVLRREGLFPLQALVDAASAHADSAAAFLAAIAASEQIDTLGAPA